MDNETLMHIVKSLTVNQDMFFKVIASDKVNNDIKVSLNELVKIAKIDPNNEKILSMISILNDMLLKNNDQVLLLRGLTGEHVFETRGNHMYCDGVPFGETWEYYERTHQCK